MQDCSASIIFESYHVKWPFDYVVCVPSVSSPYVLDINFDMHLSIVLPKILKSKQNEAFPVRN